MKPQALLMTECLQNDFIKVIKPHDALPNALHIGYFESRRLMGQESNHGPIKQMLAWAYDQAKQLHLIHIRDWHDPMDKAHAGHLAQFGNHCIQHTSGAEFVFSRPDHADSMDTIINSLSLNDFQETHLAQYLDQYHDYVIKVGIIGVWTEAKITFLVYELATRYPNFQLAICSALTASNSRQQHVNALSQLQKLFNIRVFDSIGEFQQFLVGQSANASYFSLPDRYPEIHIKQTLSPLDQQLTRYLFRDCKTVTLTALSGGYSGNQVLGSESIDNFGHQQTPFVVKIGERNAIALERTQFERIESVLGNNAPAIVEFVDLENRGAIKYRYASMNGGFSTTFQHLYQTSTQLDKIHHFLEVLFTKQLGRLYLAKQPEKTNLLNYYEFSSRWADSVTEKITELSDTVTDESVVVNQVTLPRLDDFYRHKVDNLSQKAQAIHYYSYIHGDLNGQNIILDANENVWLIDFFHTHYGHVLKDLIKLENDLMYLCTPIDTLANWQLACQFSDWLLCIKDLSASVPKLPNSLAQAPHFLKLANVIAKLRLFYPELIQHDRDPVQWQIAALRYAVHTLSFSECNRWQQQWALYTACQLAPKIEQTLHGRQRLRMDYLVQAYTGSGKIGLTILPGRQDRTRSLGDDVDVLVAENIDAVITLLSPDEFHQYGVEALFNHYDQAGLNYLHINVMDRKLPRKQDIETAVAFLMEQMRLSQSVVIHCVGGIGRSGLLAACYLKRYAGLSADAAIAHVRQIRSPRAVETLQQEAFVQQF